MRAIGEDGTSPSSSSQRKNCWSEQNRLAAVAGLCVLTRCSMKLSTCSRRSLAASSGIPPVSRNATSWRAASA